MSFREPVFELRDPEGIEAEQSCNGCAQPEVVRILTVGSRMLDGRGSGGTAYRMCRECARRFLRLMAQEYEENMP